MRNTRHFTRLLGDVRRQNNFILTIQGVTDSEKTPNNINLVVDRVFLPKFSLSVLELRHGNEAIKLPGSASWEGGTITIHDTLSKSELEAINDWIDQTYDKDGNIGISVGENGFKKLGYVTEYAGSGKFARKWTLNGLWISDFDPGELNASNAELKQITLGLQIDPSPIRPDYSETLSDWGETPDNSVELSKE